MTSDVDVTREAARKFMAQYEERTAKSKALFEEARRFIPGGVGGNSKYQSPYPLYLSEAKGKFLRDLDGNEYLDTLYGAGSCILGHSPESVVEAVTRQLSRVVSAAVATELEVELAARICKHMPSMERVRFTNSGSEATSMAVRVARAFTGRQRVAKFEGHYHGQSDELLVSGSAAFAGSPERPEVIADSPGLQQVAVDSTLVLPFNDIENTRAILQESGQDIACLLIEPMAGFGMGGIPADRDFLVELKALTRELGILLIFDEIVTGFRLGLGGAQGWFGVAPDLTTIGKALAGGFAIGAFGGRADVMEQALDMEGIAGGVKVFQSGTFSGNPVSSAAALATLDGLEKPGTYDHLNALGSQVRAGLTDVCSRLGLPTQITGLASTFNMHFNPQPIRNRRDTARTDLLRQQTFAMGCVANGVYMRPRQVGFVCVQEDASDVDHLLEVAERVLREMSGISG